MGIVQRGDPLAGGFLRTRNRPIREANFNGGFLKKPERRQSGYGSSEHAERAQDRRSAVGAGTVYKSFN